MLCRIRVGGNNETPPATLPVRRRLLLALRYGCNQKTLTSYFLLRYRRASRQQANQQEVYEKATAPQLLSPLHVSVPQPPTASAEALPEAHSLLLFFSPCLSELLYEQTPLPPIVRAWVSRRDKGTVSRTISLSDASKNQPLAELSREDLVKGWGQPAPGSSGGGGGIRKSYLVLPYFPNGRG